MMCRKPTSAARVKKTSVNLNALFSSYVMLDPPIPSVAGRSEAGVSKSQKQSARSEQKARELFTDAFVRAFNEAAPQAISKRQSMTFLMSLAGAAADMALGNSVILQLKPGLDQEHRGAIKNFIVQVLQDNGGW